MYLIFLQLYLYGLLTETYLAINIVLEHKIFFKLNALLSILLN